MDKDPDDASWTWDESYTLSENMFLASERGAGSRYFHLGRQYLDDETWFDPLSRNEHVLSGRHAYSYVNSLSSAMMAYFAAGSEKHLRAARNAFTMLQAQSYATGGWGPDELLRAPGSNDLYDSLSNTHAHFETPCGAYAQFKLTRYLVRATGDSRYGDSMERVMYNTVLGALPLQADGRHFYYSDYNFDARRVYKQARWACCSGSLPQVAADYRINLYLRGPRSVYVNLYVPSTLSWEEDDAQLSLTQAGDYPYNGNIAFSVTASKPAEVTLHFRIPAWARGAQIRVNGLAQPAPVAGQFAAVRRVWRSGDMVDLLLPLPMRLEPIDPRHPKTVALVRGPLVLMAVKSEIGAPVPTMSRSALLGAVRVKSYRMAHRRRGKTDDVGAIHRLGRPALLGLSQAGLGYRFLTNRVTTASHGGLATTCWRPPGSSGSNCSLSSSRLINRPNRKRPAGRGTNTSRFSPWA